MPDTTDILESHRRRSRLAGAAACVVTFVLYSASIAFRFGFDMPPSSSGDELSYDSIAWELSHGDGFSVDYGNAEFRRPYDQAQAAADDPTVFHISDTSSGPITYQPPVFPGVFSLTNRLAGRQFYLIRIFNALCMSATAGLVAWFLFREFGQLPVLVVIILWLADVRTRLYARAILTEPLALLLINLSAVAVTRSVEGRFLVPQLFVFYALAVAGVHAVAKPMRNHGVESH